MSSRLGIKEVKTRKKKKQEELDKGIQQKYIYFCWFFIGQRRELQT